MYHDYLEGFRLILLSPLVLYIATCQIYLSLRAASLLERRISSPDLLSVLVRCLIYQRYALKKLGFTPGQFAQPLRFDRIGRECE